MASGPSRGGDDRFAALSSDPRYRLPSSKHGRVAVDKRFSRMFKERDGDFNRKAKVDKYGRRIKEDSTKQSKHLQRLYQEAEEEEDDEGDEVDDDHVHAEPLKGAKPKRAIPIPSASEGSDDADSDGEVENELRRVEKSYDPAREGGFSSSSDDSSDEEEATEDAELEEGEQAASIPMGDASSRLALVNMDWDNIRAMDLLAVANSFVPADGRIDSVAIYPSEFGKERLEREELEGPPREIFVSASKSAKARKEIDDDQDSDAPSEDDDEAIRKKLQSGDAGEEFDTAALRRYQLDRLKYFYAVITCSSTAVAQAIYTNLDTREYLSTANFFDLRFIPDEVSFDDDRPREEVTSLDANYKPNEFVTEALTHSKVKLTWDADDATRKEVQKRAFSRNDIDENDMRAYIGGDSSSEDDDAATEGADEGKLSKKEAERQRMRALLGLANEKRAKTDKEAKPVGDMQITFTAGLSGREGRGGVFENSPPRDESTMERYVRKEKERKVKRRERMKAKRDGTTVPGNDEEKDADDSGSEIGGNIIAEDGTRVVDDKADPFDDPFFNDPEVASKSKKEKLRKEDRVKRRDAKRQQEEQASAERAQLELLMEDGKGEEMRHFDMKEIQKAAKRKSKRDKKHSRKDKHGEGDGAVADEGIETSDPRFAKLFESHEYAIDPTNPRFQKTEGMQKLLEEGRKRRRDHAGDEGGDGGGSGKREKKLKQRADEHDDDTQKLMARVKARSKKHNG